MSFGIIDSLAYFFVIIGSILAVVTIKSKNVLKKKGYYVNYFFISYSDIVNMRKLSKLQPEYKRKPSA